MIKTHNETVINKLILLLFCTGSFVFYGFFYNDHLIQKEQLQLFETTLQYFIQKILHHGGLSDYLGEFIIQFFHLPFAGAIIITLLFLLLQKITKKILQKITFKTPLFLFTILPSIGYALILMDDFYSLSGMIGLLLSLVAALSYLNLTKTRIRSLYGILLIPVVYWITGGAYLVYTFIIIVSEILLRFDTKAKNEPVILPILFLYILLAIFLPLIAREVIFKDTLLQSYLSQSYYRISIFFPLPLKIIFVSYPLFILLQFLIPGNLSEKQLVTITSGSVLILIVLSVWGVMHYGDFKAERAMFYENMVYKEKWHEIVDKAEKEQPSDQISMIAINLALAKTGELSSKMFMFDQNKTSLFFDYKRRGMAPFIAGEPYYYLGLFNFAQMFAMETIESTPDSKYPSRSFKRVAETFIINGQNDIARKYLTPLSHTLFHRKWAKERLELINGVEKISTEPYWSSLRNMRPKYDFYYNIDQTDIALRYLLISNPKNKMAFEYLMANYLLQKDFDGFLTYLPLTDGLDYNKLPLAWQQAAAYIKTRIEQVPVQLVKFNIENDVLRSIQSYAELFSEKNQDTVKIKREFGNTYWYYLHFR